MKVRHALASTALATILASAAVPAFADTINLGGYTGAIEIKFNNFESFSGNGQLQTSNTNFGVIQVTQILGESVQGSNNFNLSVWSTGQNGQFLSGVFGGIHVDSITGTPTLGSSTNSGGFIDLYLNGSDLNSTQGTGGYAAGGCAIGGTCYNTVSNVGGTNVLNLAFASGIDPLNPTTTLTSTYNLQTSPFTGTAQGYLNVVGGTEAAAFATHGVPTAFGNRDMFLQDNFCVAGSSPICGASGNWAFNSHDPVLASVIPEPSTLSVFGSALLALAFFGRWRRKRYV
jgi:hypothetical protein